MSEAENSVAIKAAIAARQLPRLKQVPRGALQEIADELGVTKSLVHYYARQMNVYTATIAQQARTAVRQRWRNPKAEIAYNHPAIPELAEKVGCSTETIRKAIRDWGYPRPARSRRHGTVSTYRSGCRCPKCSAREQERQRLHRTT